MTANGPMSYGSPSYAVGEQVTTYHVDWPALILFFLRVSLVVGVGLLAYLAFAALMNIHENVERIRIAVEAEDDEDETED